MDQELIAYLDTRFSAIDKCFEAIDRRFDAMDRRLDAMDKRFDAMDDRMNRLEGEIRLNGVQIEDLRDQIRLVAEGVASVDQKLDAFRVEVAKEFDEVRAMNRASYERLDRRVTNLERRAQAS
jgi:chromosome segregation ATPase